MHVFRPFSIQSIIPIVVLNLHPQPILQFLIDILLRRTLTTESERPCATLIIECIETSTCESIPHLFCRFCLNGVMCRIFVTKEYLSFHLKISRNVLTILVFLDKLSSSGNKAAYMPFEVRHTCRKTILYPLRILMVLLARSAVMPSYGLVRMKCGSCESCITYSSSIITYRPSSWRLSAIHDAISTSFHWVCAEFI